jgi:hypothetical protein
MLSAGDCNLPIKHLGLLARIEMRLRDGSLNCRTMVGVRNVALIPEDHCDLRDKVIHLC